MALLKLLKSIFLAYSNLKTGIKAKFFSLLKLHIIVHHAKKGGHHIKKHHKKYIGFSGSAFTAYLILFKLAAIKAIGIKIILILLTSLGIYNTGLEQHVNASNITGLDSIIFVESQEDYLKTIINDNLININLLQETGIKTSIYDDSILFMSNFDNIELLGENWEYIEGENIGNIKDLSLYNNTGTISGATRISSGKNNGTYLFDGNDYIKIKDIEQNQNTYDSGLSLSAWVKLTGEQSKSTIIEKKGEYKLELYPYDNGETFRLSFSIELPQEQNLSLTWEEKIINNNDRYYIIATYDNNFMKIYVNGELITQKKIQGIIKSHNKGNLIIGEEFNGFIDEVKIQNYALSLNEIEILQNSNLNKVDENQRIWTTYLTGNINSIEGLEIKNTSGDNYKKYINSSFDDNIQDYLTGDIITGDIITGDVLTGNIITGDIFTGDVIVGDILTGDIFTGDVIVGDILTGNIITGDIIIGNIPTGDVIIGDILTGDTFTGDVFTGDIFTGDVITGDVIIGDIFTGNIITGDVIVGDIFTGDINDIFNTSEFITIEQINNELFKTEINKNIQTLKFIFQNSGEAKQTYNLYDNRLMLMSNFDNQSIYEQNNIQSGFISDLSLQNNIGNLSGVEFNSNGIFNSTLLFDGNDELKYTNIEQNKDTYNSGITISTWIKMPLDQQYSVLVEKSSEYGLKLYPYDNGETFRLSFNLYHPTRDDLSLSRDQRITNHNDRYHIVATYDNNLMKIYIDGQLITQKETNGIIKSHTKGNLTIGKNFNGYMDELQIYNYALSEQEIELISKSSLSRINENKRELKTILSGHLFNETEQIGIEMQDKSGLNHIQYFNILENNNLSGINLSGDILSGNDSIWINNLGSELIELNQIEINVVEADIDSSIKKMTIISQDQKNNKKEFNLYDDRLLFMSNFDSYYNLSTGFYNSGIAYDLSIYNNSGIINGAIQTKNGKSNSSFIFDGNDEIKYTNIEQSRDTYNSGLTLSTWIQLSGGQTESTIIHKNSEYILKIQPYENGESFRVSFNLYHPTRDNLDVSWDQKIINNNDWYHIVATYDNNLMKIYVDGQLITQKEATGKIKTHSKGNLIIGNNFIGSIDELYIYNYALSEQEIHVLHKTNLDKFDYQFQEITTNLSGNIFKDSNILGVEIQNLSGDIHKNEINLKSGINKKTIEEILTEQGFNKKGKLRYGENDFILKELNGNICAGEPIIIKGDNNDTVEIPECVKVKNKKGQKYKGTIQKPTQINEDTINLSGNFESINHIEIYKIITIGNTDDTIRFTDEQGDATKIKVNVELSKGNVGDEIQVYYSQDDINREHLTSTTITNTGGKNEIEFLTDHFTTFIIGGQTGNFVINNDDIYTSSTNVNLTISGSNITHMRFAENTGDLILANRETFSENKNRILSSTNGIKTVYAQLSGLGGTITTQDTILLDIGAWNNDNFIDSTFWSSNPTSGDIKSALYGDGIGGSDTTAYSKYRSGVTCNPANMNVIYVDPGVDTLTSFPVANTIYVLNGGTYIKTATISAGGNCIAIIGKNRSYLFQDDALGNGAIYATSRSNIIVDNLDIDAVSNGTGGIHYSTAYGIYLRNAGNGHTINNVKVSNTRNYGIYFNTSPNNVLHNVQIYNSKTDGIYVTANSRNTLIQNSQFFNNGRYGVKILSPDNRLNNIQSYNNLNAGIYINSVTAINNVLNNIQTYNNALYGIYLSSTSGTTINNVSSYGNNTYGLYIYNAVVNSKINNVNLFNNGKGYYSNNATTQTGNYFYGTIKIFGNGDNTFGVGISTGGNEYSTLGWTTGSVSTSEIVGCDEVTKPDGFLYHPNDTGCDFRGVNGTLAINTYNHAYVYGSGLDNQIQPVDYTGGLLGFDDIPYNNHYKIAQINAINTIGYFKFKNNTYVTDVTGVELYLGYDILGATYTITGDFEGSPLIGTMTGYSKIIQINLDPTIGTKHAYITFTSGTNTRSYASQIEYIGPISDPIIKKYFGYNSFYTDAWEYNFCDPRNITVQTVEGGINTLPTPVANTIYLLSSGNYISTGVKSLLECNVLAGTGDVFHFTDINRANATIKAGDRNIIIDNIKFNGRDDGMGDIHKANSAAIYATVGYNLTVNDVDVYNHTLGIYALYHKDILINNTNVYNNFNGTTASYPIQISAGANVVLNNMKIFNNYSAGIYILATSSNVSVNNILSFNSRQQGIYALNYGNLLINNSNIYNNNTYGIRSESSFNSLINNSSVYNNTTAGFTLNGTNRYYGLNKAYANPSNVIQGSQGGNEFAYLGWIGGSFVSTGNISCDTIVNPKNSITNTYLQTSTLCNTKSYNPTISGYTSEYVFGSGISKQIQPVYYKNQEIIKSNIPYDSGLYIAESEISNKINISLNAPGNFSFSGNIEVKNYQQTITGQYNSGQYFSINDPIGSDTGWYTTISATHLSGSHNHIITNNNLFIKSNGINTLSGEQNSGIMINTLMNDYVPLSGELIYIYRNSASNNNKKGQYGDQPYLKLNIPAYQPPGMYSGTIIFTLYEN